MVRIMEIREPHGVQQRSQLDPNTFPIYIRVVQQDG
jgi:hypothetical protein